MAQGNQVQDGSPFVVGRPLRPDEPIFGREDAFEFIAGQLARFSSANLVGERRMGKSSLLSHLVGRQENHLRDQPEEPPLVLAWVDLQAGKMCEARFYGLALRELLDRLPSSRSAEARQLQTLLEQLQNHPESDYDTFERTLKHWSLDNRNRRTRPGSLENHQKVSQNGPM